MIFCSCVFETTLLCENGRSVSELSECDLTSYLIFSSVPFSFVSVFPITDRVWNESGSLSKIRLFSIFYLYILSLYFISIFYLYIFGGAGMAQWWEHSPPTNVTRVRFPDPASNVGWVCWFSSLHREAFSGYSGFPSPQKPDFDLIVLIVNFSYSAVSLISAPALEKTRHLNKVPYLTLPFYPRAAASPSTVWALQQPHKQSLHHSVQLLRSLPRALARASSQQKTRALSWRMVC